MSNTPSISTHSNTTRGTISPSLKTGLMYVQMGAHAKSTPRVARLR